MSGLSAVLAAAERRSATQAAAALGTTAATVLRRIDGVESTLGVSLFQRLPTGLAPTAALQTILPWLERCAESVDGIRRDVTGFDQRPSGVVRIAAPATIASYMLVPQLHRLRARQPGITVELASDTRVVDLGQREADLAVRTIRPDAGDLTQRKLADYAMAVACAPGLVATAKADLAAMPWVDWERSMAHIPEARWRVATFPDARVTVHASELDTLVRAARAGLGAVAVAEPIAAAAGGLVKIPLADAGLPHGSLWLVVHRALRHVPRVAAVWEWLSEVFSDVDGVGPVRLEPAW